MTLMYPRILTIFCILYLEFILAEIPSDSCAQDCEIQFPENQDDLNECQEYCILMMAKGSKSSSSSSKSSGRSRSSSSGWFSSSSSSKSSTTTSTKSKSNWFSSLFKKTKYPSYHHNDYDSYYGSNNYNGYDYDGGSSMDADDILLMVCLIGGGVLLIFFGYKMMKFCNEQESGYSETKS
ncbi:hypothetical protein ACFFRR_000656 [Megaselia abdita]